MRRLALVAVILVMCLGGCSGREDPPDSSAAKIAEITAAVRTGLSSMPGVSSAEVRYENRFMDPGKVVVEVSVATDGEVTPVVEEAKRLLWTSQLRPLSLMTIGASVKEDQMQSRYGSVIFADEAVAQELTEKYGPRPPAPAPEPR